MTEISIVEKRFIIAPLLSVAGFAEVTTVLSRHLLTLYRVNLLIGIGFSKN